jgi:anti-anti-sigma factor
MKGYAQVHTLQENGVLVARVEGELDLANVGEVGANLLAAVPNTSSALIVDLSATTYLDSAGIKLLVDLNQRLRVRQQALRVVVPPTAIIRRVLELARLDKAVPIDESLDEALARLADEARAQRPRQPPVR